MSEIRRLSKCLRLGGCLVFENRRQSKCLRLGGRLCVCD